MPLSAGVLDSFWHSPAAACSLVPTASSRVHGRVRDRGGDLVCSGSAPLYPTPGGFHVRLMYGITADRTCRYGAEYADSVRYLLVRISYGGRWGDDTDEIW